MVVERAFYQDKDLSAFTAKDARIKIFAPKADCTMPKPVRRLIGKERLRIVAVCFGIENI